MARQKRQIEKTLQYKFGEIQQQIACEKEKRSLLKEKYYKVQE